MITCIDCKKEIYPTSTRCRSCNRKERNNRKSKIVKCEYCHKEFRRPNSLMQKRNFCNKVCFDTYWTENAKGWGQPGDYKTICINGKEILEHRHIMEVHLNRKLRQDEVVHHINRDPSDNRIENLQVMTRSEHVTLHNTGQSRKGQKMPPMPEEQKRKISETKKYRNLMKRSQYLGR